MSESDPRLKEAIERLDRAEQALLDAVMMHDSPEGREYRAALREAAAAKRKSVNAAIEESSSVA